ncbi:MAG: transcriptional repressor [Ruminococcaceae bacterium]|nr:transcriptional repressor [Oscillospiraceae bacterium]
MGHNFSSKREAIFKTIASTKSHPSARWVYDELKDEIPNLSLGTVYRNIALFKEQGKIISVANVDGEERIDADVSDHAHFVCERCGGVYDLHSSELSPLEKELSQKGFEIKRKNVVFHGICCECSKN